MGDFEGPVVRQTENPHIRGWKLADRKGYLWVDRRRIQGIYSSSSDQACVIINSGEDGWFGLVANVETFIAWWESVTHDG